MENESKDDVAAVFGTQLPSPPSAAQQSWGAVISIIVIVLMVVIGAFYSWGKRVAQDQTYTPITATTTEESSL